MQLKHHPMFSRARGFSLIEVLVALLVISIGLLGIAKMQALALANTNGGRLRALAAIEAASLAASMQAERNYWGNLAASETITITSTSTAGTTTVSSPGDSTLAGSVTCPATTSTQFHDHEPDHHQLHRVSYLHLDREPLYGANRWLPTMCNSGRASCKRSWARPLPLPSLAP